MDFVDRRRGTSVNLGSNPIADSIARQKGKPGPSTRAKNKRMAGTVADVQAGRAATFTPSGYTPPPATGTTAAPGSSRDILPTNHKSFRPSRDAVPQSAGRAFFGRIWRGADK